MPALGNEAKYAEALAAVRQALQGADSPRPPIVRQARTVGQAAGHGPSAGVPV